MMFHWSVVLMSVWGGMVIGYYVGRSFREEAKVTTKVISPMDEVTRHDWLVLLEPHIHRFEVGAIFGSGVTFNKEGAKAMAVLLTDMANKLDYARHVGRKAKENS